MKEKKKLEGELEAMGQSEDFELIDENKKAYDEVVEELKKLENEQFAPRPEWTVEEKEAYRLKKEELLEEKAALADLLEKQLQMNTAMPEQRRQLEMRVYSLEMRLSVLEKEKEKEHAACGTCQRENEEAVESTLDTLRQCEELLKKYQTAVVHVGLRWWVDVQKSVREAPQYVFTTDDEEAEWLLNSSENSMMDACMREVPEMEVSAKQLLEENVCDFCSEEEEAESSTEATEAASVYSVEEMKEEAKFVAQSEGTALENVYRGNTQSEGTALENVYHGNAPQLRVQEPIAESVEMIGRWMENAESKVCLCCGKRFGVFRRRHVRVRWRGDG